MAVEKTLAGSVSHCHAETAAKRHTQADNGFIFFFKIKLGSVGEGPQTTTETGLCIDYSHADHYRNRPVYRLACEAL